MRGGRARLGSPGSSIEVLVSDDANSAFGIMGRSMLDAGESRYYEPLGSSSYLVQGVPTPGALATFALGALVLTRRR